MRALTCSKFEANGPIRSFSLMARGCLQILGNIVGDINLVFKNKGPSIKPLFA